MGKVLFACMLILLASQGTRGWGVELTATGHDSRIDLTWTGTEVGYRVYRSDTQVLLGIRPSEARAGSRATG